MEIAFFRCVFRPLAAAAADRFLKTCAGAVRRACALRGYGHGSIFTYIFILSLHCVWLYGLHLLFAKKPKSTNDSIKWIHFVTFKLFKVPNQCWNVLILLQLSAESMIPSTVPTCKPKFNSIAHKNHITWPTLEWLSKSMNKSIVCLYSVAVSVDRVAWGGSLAYEKLSNGVLASSRTKLNFLYL